MIRFLAPAILAVLFTEPVTAQVTIVESGDSATIVATFIVEDNAPWHLEQIKVFSRIWETCGPGAAATVECAYGALYKPLIACTTALIEKGGCTQAQVGEEVRDSRTLEEWLAASLLQVLQSMTRSGKSAWEDQLLPDNPSQPSEITIGGGRYDETE